MSYYRMCPNCGANLDPGERCDCAPPAKSQAFANLQKKAAASSAKVDSGKAEKVIADQFSASIITKNRR